MAGGARRRAGEINLAVPLTVTGKLRRRRSLAAEEFIYARARARLPLKAALPSPLMLAMRWSPEHSAAAYPEPFALFADAVDILRAEVAELASLGCEYVQIDAPELATLVDPSTRERVFEAHGISTARMLGEGVEMLNALADVSGRYLRASSMPRQQRRSLAEHGRLRSDLQGSFRARHAFRHFPARIR